MASVLAASFPFAGGRVWAELAGSLVRRRAWSSMQFEGYRLVPFSQKLTLLRLDFAAGDRLFKVGRDLRLGAPPQQIAAELESLGSHLETLDGRFQPGPPSTLTAGGAEKLRFLKPILSTQGGDVFQGFGLVFVGPNYPESFEPYGRQAIFLRVGAPPAEIGRALRMLAGALCGPDRDLVMMEKRLIGLNVKEYPALQELLDD
jgi:hypothetical protein